jgi:hypothetical protein
MMTRPFAWGETVRVSLRVPDAFRPGALAEVIGLRVMPHSEIVTCEHSQERVTANLVLIEFADGNSVELPDYLLERTNDA